MSVTSALLKGCEQNKNVSVNSVPFLIGRCKTADLIIAHLNVSRNHCRILKEDDEWKMCDFSSSGTFINDVLVGKGKSAVLKDGDKIRFGPVESKLFWTFEEVKPLECSESVLNQEKKESSDGTEEKNDESRSVRNFQHSKFDNFLKNTAVLGIQSNNSLNVSGVEFDERDLIKKELENKLNKQEEEKEILIKKLKEMEDTQKKLFEQISYQKIGCSVEVEGDLKNEKNEETNRKEKKDFPNSSVEEENNKGLTGKETDTKSRVLEDFANLMETELQCTICAELFVKAITLSCSHTFCKHCITQWKKKQKTCPICRKKITNEIRSLVVDNYIDKVVETLSAELKQRRQAIIEERKEIIPAKKRRTAKS